MRAVQEKGTKISSQGFPDYHRSHASTLSLAKYYFKNAKKELPLCWFPHSSIEPRIRRTQPGIELVFIGSSFDIHVAKKAITLTVKKVF